MTRISNTPRINSDDGRPNKFEEIAREDLDRPVFIPDPEPPIRSRFENTAFIIGWVVLFALFIFAAVGPVEIGTGMEIAR